MSKLTKRALFDYFVDLAGQLGLGQWEFVFSPDEPEAAPGSFLTDADIMINDNAEIATLRFGEHLLTQRPEPEYHRKVLIHEALHCYRARTSTMVRLDLETLLGKAADAVFWSSYARLRELEIDATARAIAPLLPLPPWAKA